MLTRIAILGAGVSGQGARRLADSLGLSSILFDQAGAGDRSVLTEADLENVDLIVLSPGFDPSSAWRVLAESSGKPCLSELAFAARYWKGPLYAVTGTNGKTTLTAFLQQAFECAGKRAVAAGNIGEPLSDVVLSDANHHDAIAVIEVSSFQAELVDGLELDGLIWTNFAEDHLDRYGSMAAYFEAKAKLFTCLKSKGSAVISADVAPWIDDLGNGFEAYTIAGDHPQLVDQLAPDSVFRHFPYSENFSLAAELWYSLGEPMEALIEAAASFTLAPHRLGVVAESEGVRYWNDSKATNFHATLAALDSVARPIVWIGGGCSKGGDVEGFAAAVSEKVDVAIIYGDVADRLAKVLSKKSDQVYVEPRFTDAVHKAVELSSTFDLANVLLSPGFASFDQFDSYSERGNLFTSLVLSLKKLNEPS